MKRAIQMVAPVIPQGEAIHTGTLDCFTLRVRNDMCNNPVYAIYEVIQRTRMDCFTLRDDVCDNPMFAIYKAIQRTHIDCFTLQVRKDVRDHLNGDR
jgi:hypothetical protein